MPRTPIKEAKEVTTCDLCGNRLVIPPGVYYRGIRMHLQEARRYEKLDHDNEIKAPHLAEIEQEIRAILNKDTIIP